jgi:hypothetical protein
MKRYVEGAETHKSQPPSKPAAVVAKLPRREENLL